MLVTDISPALLEQVQEAFQLRVSADPVILSFGRKLGQGTATQQDVQLYASQLGAILGEVLGEVLALENLPDGRLYWNIAEKVILPTLEENFRLVFNAASDVQRAIDAAEQIGLIPIAPETPRDRMKGICDSVTVDGLTAEEVRERLREPVRNITAHYHDDFIKANAEFREKAGMSPKIIRIPHNGACAWCKALGGTYDYDDVSNAGNDVFRRHENCRCFLSFRNSKKIANVWKNQRRRG